MCVCVCVFLPKLFCIMYTFVIHFQIEYCSCQIVIP